MKVERLSLRLFLEGVEIPCVSATVSMRRNSPATAVIQIVPTPVAHFILPRTVVHLFFADDTVPATTVGSPYGGPTTQLSNAFETPEDTGEGTPTPPVVDSDMIRYRLLFCGEVVGLQYQKRPMSRAVVLQCVDFSNYWDSILHDRRGGLFPPTRMARLQSISQGSFYDLLGGDTGAVYDIMSKPPDFFPEMTLESESGGRRASYMGAVMHLMETIFGTYHRSGRINSQNPFASMAELRLRLLQQVGIPPEDSAPLALMRNQGFGSLWRRSVRGLPAQFSFRTLMNALMQYTFYSVFPLTTPRYRPPEGTYAEMMGWSRSQPQEERQEDRRGPSLADQIFAKVKRWQESLSAHFTQIEPLGLPEQMSFAGNNQVFTPIKDECVETQHSIPERLVRTSDRWALIRNGIGFLATMCGTGWRQAFHLAAHVRNATDQCSGIMQRLRELGAGGTSRGGEQETRDGRPAFLYSQLFAPDIWFCPPPRCNVLWPEFVSAVSMSKNFLQEPTRLMVQGYSAFFGSDPFFDRYYFAPTSLGLMREQPITRSGGSVATGNARIASDLMEHELFTGIIPAFQKMSDREMTIGRNIAEVGRDNPDYQGESMDYFQRVTNFIFFKTRFASRTMSISSIFNPFVVPGYPALVPDSHADSVDTAGNEALLAYAKEQLTDIPEAQSSDILTLIAGRTGVHHLGMIEAVTHSVDASGGGSTDIVMTYARDHREAIEFFGADITEARRRRRVFREVHHRLSQEERSGLITAGGSLLTSGMIFTSGAMAGGAARGIADPNYYQAVGQGGAAIVGAGATLIGYGAQGFIPQRETVTEKLWTVAVYGEAPQVGGMGPWGGPIKEVRDVTDRYAGVGTLSARDRRKLEENEQRRAEATSELDEAIRRKALATTEADRGVADMAIRAAEEDIATLDRERSEIMARGTPRSSRTLSLYGTYGNGARLPAASIPANLIGSPHPSREFGPDVVGLVGDPSGNQLVTLMAYEIVEDISAGADKVDFPVEEAVRPPWYPAIWTNSQIGGAVYLSLLGTTAITDPIGIIQSGALDRLPGMQTGAITALYQDASGDGTSGQMLGSILNGATIQQAVDFLVHTYSRIKLEGFDAAEFARQYTYRNIASMFDMFGSSDLEMKGDGTIVKGIEGFHSKAFGPYHDLFGIAPGDTVRMLGIEENDVAARARLDVRGQRHALILTYQQELQDRLLMRES